VLFPHLRDPHLYEFLDSEPPRSVAILEQQYRRWEPRRSPDGAQAWLNWTARLRGAGYVGWFQATVHADGRADLAYLIFREHQRQGYAVEACRAVMSNIRAEHGARTIRATIDAENVASIALAQRLGLTRAGQSAHGIWFESRLEKKAR
jgi:RimJ/RimL family protein N-acetyltransferase